VGGRGYEGIAKKEVVEEREGLARRLRIHDTRCVQLTKGKIMFESKCSERGRATKFSNMG
jgi:hypothetical protein